MRGSLLTVAFAIVALTGCGRKEVEQPKTVAPYIISRSADGCTVYAFNPDGWRWRYFTRCETQTTTDNDYTVTERIGKTTVYRNVEDSITQTGK